MSRFRPSAIMTLVLIAALMAPSAARAATTLADVEQDIIRLCNQARVQNGLGALQPEPRLTEAARQHSQEMIDLDYFSHTSPTAGLAEVADRIRAAGATNMVAGENIASMEGYSIDQVAQETVQGWLNSPGHRSNMLHASYTLVGLGVKMHGEEALITMVLAHPTTQSRK